MLLGVCYAERLGFVTTPHTMPLSSAVLLCLLTLIDYITSQSANPCVALLGVTK